MTNRNTPVQKRLTMIEFQGDDFEIAQRIGRALGYTQLPYTSTSDLIGTFCLSNRPSHRAGCIIKTEEFGFMFVQDLDDLKLQHLVQVTP